MEATEQRSPTAVVNEVLRLRLDPDLASDLTADIIFGLRRVGFRIVSADLRPDLSPVEIVARSLASHTRIAQTAARGAAGWILADLHDTGWRLSKIDDPPPTC